MISNNENHTVRSSKAWGISFKLYNSKISCLKNGLTTIVNVEKKKKIHIYSDSIRFVERFLLSFFFGVVDEVVDLSKGYNKMEVKIDDVIGENSLRM